MRYVLAIGGVLAIIGVLVFIKFSQISMLIGFGKEMEKAGPPPQAVATALSDTQNWEASVEAVGTVASVKGVAISNEVPGTVKKIKFESGATVKLGDVLVELDTSVEQAQVGAAVVRRDLATVNLKRSRALSKEGVGQQSQVDTDESQLKSATAELEVLYAQISRKSIRAPFAGRLGIRTVNVGQYINPGTALTTLEAVEGAYIDFTLPQQQKIEVGMKVRVTFEGAPDLSTDGTVAAIDSSVDAVSRTAKLRASVPNKDQKLKPGMFAKVSLQLPKTASFVTVPTTAVVHASFGDSIFVLEAPEGGTEAKGPNGEPVKIAVQKFVRVGEHRGDFVAILEGAKAGEEVVTAGAFKLRNKASVFVNNDLAAKPELNPKPENH